MSRTGEARDLVCTARGPRTAAGSSGGTDHVSRLGCTSLPGLLRLLIGIVAVLALFGRAAQAAPHPTGGGLDPAFGSGGTVVTAPGGAQVAQAVALQNDGKIVVAGCATSLHCYQAISAQGFVVARYDASGALDASFGTGGIVRTDVGAGNAGATGVAVTAGGNIVAAGTAPICHTPGNVCGWGLALVGYLPDGSLDPNFGVGGKVTTDWSTTGVALLEGWAMTMQPDGKFVLAGRACNDRPFAGTGCHMDAVVARYLANGLPDASFGAQGIALSNLPDDDFALAVTLQPDGKIVTSGIVYSDSASGVPASDFALTRFTPQGLLDLSFGQSGTVRTHAGGSELAWALTVQMVGGAPKLVATGASAVWTCTSFCTKTSDAVVLARYDLDGSLDPTFGGGGTGIVHSDFSGGQESVRAIVIEPVDGGRIVVGGALSGDFLVARYTAAGALDTTFGTRRAPGRVTTDIGGDDLVYALAVQPADLKVVAVGGVRSDWAAIGIARYLP